MKPVWFKCKNCLFWNNKFRECYHEPQGHVAAESKWCANWICATCWQPWDDLFYTPVEYKNGELVDGSDDQGYTDHTQCKPVKLGVKP